MCTPGLEAALHQELAALGVRPKPAGPGTVEFSATPRQLYAANVWLRTASRVVVRVAIFRSTAFAHFQERANQIDWSPWLADGMAPSFRVSSNDSKLYHTKGIAQRLHQVVGRPSTGEPEQLFVVRIERNTVTISVDASGEGLHHRPWRTELGAAPLRTTMASALLMLTGWDPTSAALIDPFCGSGTIPIEAALMARNLPPGGTRPFAFQHWPSFETGSWASVNGQIAAASAVASSASDNPPPVGSTSETRDSVTPAVGNATTGDARIFASDRDEVAVNMARANAERAGVADDIVFTQQVVSHLGARPGPGLVATNPPYGRRLGDAKLQGLYRRLGAVVRERFADWDLALISAEAKLASATDGRLKTVARFGHGGVPVRISYRPAAAEPVTTSSAEQLDGVVAETGEVEAGTVVDPGVDPTEGAE